MIEFFRSHIALTIVITLAVNGANPGPANAADVELLRDIQRNGSQLTAPVPPDAKSGQVYLPRYFASLRTIHWATQDDAPLTAEAAPTITPEPDYWIVKWDKRPPVATHLRVTFDKKPLLASELKPSQPAGDGTLDLPAALAFTKGEKVRFEPQTFKNTVGYWVGAQDHARWAIALDSEHTHLGTYNVGILQGCGKGQGGSEAELRILPMQPGGSTSPMAVLPFEVVETGHFQNFQWRQIGQIEVTEQGVFWLEIRPKKIKKNALMDVRRVVLTPAPPLKKP